MFYFNELFFRLQYALGSFVLTFLVVYFYKNILFVLLTFPLLDSSNSLTSFIYTNPTELFTTHFLLILLISVVFQASYFFWHFVDFIKTSLSKSEYKNLLATVLFFILGLSLFNFLFFFTVFPKFWYFFYNFNFSNSEPQTLKFFLELRVHEYFSFVFILILSQGLIGWLMVKTGLKDRPDVSHLRLAAHLSMALIILSFILWKIFGSYRKKIITNQKFKFFALSNIILIFLQIIFGAFVAGLNAGHIYPTFPMMGEDYIPNELFKQNSFSDLIHDAASIQFFHRILAYLIFINTIFFLFSSFKILKKTTVILFLMILLQITIGILTLVWHVPILLASLHQLNAIVIYSISLYIFFLSCNKLSNSRRRM
jgi:heme A synthase